MKTIKAFCAKTHLPAGLVRAVIRQIGGWQSFKESADDVANHGAAGGFSGFIYYTETVKFARNNRADILAVARDMAADIGEPGAYALIAGFNCFRGDDLAADDIAEAIHARNDDNATAVYNALAWFALEEVARAYVDLVECDA